MPPPRRFAAPCLDCPVPGRLEEARAYCENKGLDLRILPGCEIQYYASVPDRLAAGSLLPLGASHHVLIEFIPDVSLFEIREAADSLYRAGYPPVLAHVERYRSLRRSPEKAMSLRAEYGLIYQMSCAAIARPRGRRNSACARMLAQAIDVIATDAMTLFAIAGSSGRSARCAGSPARADFG